MPGILYYLVVIGLLALCAGLLCRLVLLRRGLRSVCEQLDARLEDSSGAPLCCTGRDKYLLSATERLNGALTKLSVLQARYAAGDAEVKTAITNISHDLRTPLTAIAGYTELMKKEPLSERQSGYLARIEERTRAMTALTEELFHYSLTISDETALKTEPVDMGAVLEGCAVDFYERLSEKGIAPIFEKPETPVIRALDRDALSRVFGNMMSNAVKYSSGDLRVSLSGDGRVVFANAAPGLTPVEAAKLFDRFYTVSTARNSTGLGLSIAKDLTERMGGRIGAAVRDGTLEVWCKF